MSRHITWQKSATINSSSIRRWSIYYWIIEDQKRFFWYENVSKYLNRYLKKYTCSDIGIMLLDIRIDTLDITNISISETRYWNRSDAGNISASERCVFFGNKCFMLIVYGVDRDHFYFHWNGYKPMSAERFTRNGYQSRESWWASYTLKKTNMCSIKYMGAALSQRPCGARPFFTAIRRADPAAWSCRRVQWRALTQVKREP